MRAPTDGRPYRSITLSMTKDQQLESYFQRNLCRKTVNDSRGTQASLEGRRNPSGFYPCFKPGNAARHDAECRSAIDNRRPLMIVESDIQTGVEIEKEFEEVTAFAGKDVFDSPRTCALVERDYSSMSDGRG